MGMVRGVNAAGSGLVAVLMFVLVVSLIKLALIALVVLLLLGVLSGLFGKGCHRLADHFHARHARKLNARRPHPGGFHMPPQRPQSYYSNRR